MHIGYGAAFQHVDGSPDAEFVREELHLCVMAETAGFDSIWLPEHHFSDYAVVPDPLQMLSYLAAQTDHVGLGAGVVVLPWHDPIRVAEQLSVLDHLSNGRVILGVGRGLARAEFEGLRVDQNEARESFVESAELLLTALETGIMEGGHKTKQPRREIRPRPLKSFRGRAFSAAMSPDSAPIMARLGLGLLIVNPKPPAILQSDLAKYDDVWHQTHGPDNHPPRPFHSAIVFVDESADRAAELARKYAGVSHRTSVLHYGMMEPEFGTAKGYEHYAQTMKISASANLETLADEFVSKKMPHGNPQQVLDYLNRLKESTDAQGIFLHFKFGGMPYAEAERNMLCFARHCLPALKSWPSTSSLRPPDLDACAPRRAAAAARSEAAGG